MKSPPPLLPVAAALVALLAVAWAGNAQARGGGTGQSPGLKPGAVVTPAPAQPAPVLANNEATVAGEVLVKLRSAEALQPLLARHALTLAGRFGARPIYRLRVVGATSAQDAVARLLLDPEVMIAEPNTLHRSPEARRNAVWAIGTLATYTTQWAPQALRLPQAQALATGEGVRVAVLDTGVDTSHPLLAGRLLPGRDFVDGDSDASEAYSPASASYGHGTHVAGLVATVAPAARIMPLRVLDAEGSGNAWVLAEAVLHAIDPDGNPATDDGAHVINLSLGSLARTQIMGTIAQIAGCTPAVPGDAIGDRSDPGYRDDDARCSVSSGVLIVAAAGNDGSASIKQYPAAEGAYTMLPVGASNAQRRLASFSNSGSWVSLAAPGESITSAMPGGGWATWSGTSMAAPLAAGVAALVRSAQPLLTPKEVATRLQRTAATLCGTNLAQVDAYAAVVNIEPRSSKCK